MHVLRVEQRRVYCIPDSARVTWQEICVGRRTWSRGAVLADLYGSRIPSVLLRAHLLLDQAVEGAYGLGFSASDEELTGFLLRLYEERTRTERGTMMEEAPLFQVRAGRRCA